MDSVMGWIILLVCNIIEQIVILTELHYRSNNSQFKYRTFEIIVEWYNVYLDFGTTNSLDWMRLRLTLLSKLVHSTCMHGFLKPK